jgi:hypothetical protein
MGNLKKLIDKHTGVFCSSEQITMHDITQVRTAFQTNNKANMLSPQTAQLGFLPLKEKPSPCLPTCKKCKFLDISQQPRDLAFPGKLASFVWPDSLMSSCADA